MFKKRETSKQIADRLIKLTNGKDCGIFPPPMKAQTAVDELCRYLLGDDWYSTNPLSAEQLNTEIVYEIECRYKKHRRLKNW